MAGDDFILIGRISTPYNLKIKLFDEQVCLVSTHPTDGENHMSFETLTHQRWFQK